MASVITKLNLLNAKKNFLSSVSHYLQSQLRTYDLFKISRSLIYVFTVLLLFFFLLLLSLFQFSFTDSLHETVLYVTFSDTSHRLVSAGPLSTGLGDVTRAHTAVRSPARSIKSVSQELPDQSRAVIAHPEDGLAHAQNSLASEQLQTVLSIYRIGRLLVPLRKNVDMVS